MASADQAAATEAAASNGSPIEVPQPPQDPVLETTRYAINQATRRLEQAFSQEAELEAWTVFGASLLKLPPGNLDTEDSKLPGGIQDGLASVQDATDTGMASLPPPPLASGGQWASTLHRSVQAHSITRMAEQAQTLLAERVVEGPALKQALTTLQTTTPRDPNRWLAVLDERLRELREYHARHAPAIKRQRLGNPAADGYDLSAAVQQHLAPLQQEETLYSPEEVLGKYLDMQSLYQQALHDGLLWKDTKYYIDFLQALAKGKLASLVISTRRRHYERWLNALQAYLESYLQRVAPLLDLKQFRATDTESADANGHAENTTDNDNDKNSLSNIELSAFATAEELAAKIDADTLKKELARLGLKCGGTPADRAKRLFLVRNVKSLDELPKSAFAKKKKGNSNGTAVGNPALGGEKLLKTVQALLNQVQPVLEATIRRNERRQGQNLAEREREIQEDLYGTEAKANAKQNEGDDSEDDDAPNYNPKNAVLDWDGKPIPYWLFKLHGLNVYYPCEICQGERYRGRRNFELHFAEQKHSAGMKSLGIPNTKHFHGVTTIDDARELWKTLQSNLEKEEFNGTQEEEYEDSHGNVLSRSTYEDLARQGLL